MGDENRPSEAIRKVTVLGDTMLVEIDVGLALPDDETSDTILLRRAELVDADARIDGDILHLTVALPADRRGRTQRSPDTAMVAGDAKEQLAVLVRTAHKRLTEIGASPLELPQPSGMKAAATEWIRQRIVIGLLAPDIQKALLTGTAPAHVTPEWMLAQEWPVEWQAQRRLIGMAA